MVSFERDAFSVAVRLAISWSVTCAMILSFDAESLGNEGGATETSDRNKTRPRIFPVELGRYLSMKYWFLL